MRQVIKYSPKIVTAQNTTNVIDSHFKHSRNKKEKNAEEIIGLIMTFKNMIMSF